MSKVTRQQFKKEYSELRLYIRRSYESLQYLPCGADDAAHERIQYQLKQVVQKKPYLACIYRHSV